MGVVDIWYTREVDIVLSMEVSDPIKPRATQAVLPNVQPLASAPAQLPPRLWITMAEPVFPAQQISLLGSVRAGKPVPMGDVAPEQQARDRQDFEGAFQGPWKMAPPHNTGFVSAGPLYLGRAHHEHVRQLHVALERAVTDIVERWYGDEKGAFPSRMPLRENEDRILRVSRLRSPWTVHGIKSDQPTTGLMCMAVDIWSR